MQRRAYFTMTREALVGLLGLPSDYRILAMRETDKFDVYGIDICIEGPDLAEVSEGKLTPRIDPVFRKETDGRVTLDVEYLKSLHGGAR